LDLYNRCNWRFDHRLTCHWWGAAWSP
jgi:hypothetical protein